MTEPAEPRPGTWRVDAHHHVWDLAVRDQPWTEKLPVLRRSFELDELRPSLQAHDIAATVLVQTGNVPEESVWLLALADGDPQVRGVVGWVDLTADVSTQVERLRRSPGGDRLVGVRHQVQEEADPRWLCRPDVRRGLAALAETGLVYDLVVIPHQLQAVAETVEALPQLRFVLDHAGKPAIASRRRQPWATRLAELGRLPNLAVKLSGLVTEADHLSWEPSQVAPFAEVILDAFPPTRTIYGSDWPVCLLAASYDTVIALAEQLTDGLDPVEREAVFGGTAERWYGLAR
ncbi:amidohydrolase family protein [Angustibacter sp. McL0619]|uniref:amidohydrolase family protein n=1 Tax=Angustibacter sp. McL0619 TaxID=3415676 RepID=UPI003CEAB42C